MAGNRNYQDIPKKKKKQKDKLTHILSLPVYY